MTTVKNPELETFIKKNKGLVHKVCQKYVNSLNSIRHITGAEYEDLVQVGTIGLIKAKKGFRTDYGCKMSTYAVHMIDGEIKRYIRDKHFIKASRWLKHYYYKLRQLDCDKTDERTVSEKLNLSLSKAKELINYEPAYKSIDDPVNCINDEDSDITVLDTISVEGFEDEVTDKIILEDFMNTLTDREKKVWFMYHEKGLTQAEIGKIVGLSQVQVSRILAGIEKKAEIFGKRQGLRH